VLVFVAATAWSVSAFAGPVEVTWTAPAACPSEGYVVGEVGRILDGASGPQKKVHAHADVVCDEGGAWHVTLVTRTEDAPGRRTFSAESCEALADATALILAMTVNPLITPPPPREPSVEPPSHGSDARSVPPAKPSGSASLARFALAASLAGTTGVLPSASFGPEISLGWLPGRVRVELRANYAVPQRAASGAPVGADFQLWSAGARVGYAWPIGPLAVGPSVVADLERMSASGFGGSLTFRQSAVLVGMGGGLLVVWSPLLSFAVRLAAEGEALAPRPSFVVVEPAPRSPELVHRPSALAGRATVGVEWHFF
jgi:hypothetical protein